MLKCIFKVARENKPKKIVLDEIDFMLGGGTESGQMKTQYNGGVLSELLSKLDGNLISSF